MYSLLRMVLGNVHSLEESVKNLDSIVADEPLHQPQLRKLFDSPDILNADWKPTSTITVKEPPMEVSTHQKSTFYYY